MPIYLSRKKSARPQQPFRFIDLPGELRNEIYRLCLVNDGSPMSVSLGSCSDSIMARINDLRGRNNVLVRLKTNCRGPHPSSSLLRVSSQIHDEAAAILYGHKALEFRGRTCWTAFFYFNWRLSTVCRHSIRDLGIEFPQFERIVTGDQAVCQFTDEGNKGLDIIEGFQNLQRLTLHLRESIADKDIQLLHKMHFILRNVRSVAIHIVSFVCKTRRVRISRWALEKIQDWGWSIEFDNVK
ncbi:MAG: hypothetical protein Q9191_002343 [Dirinaria sp. TL-2023a]